jgi:hypothetical protein
MTITTYLSGRRKLTTTVDDSAVRAKDAKESMKKAISGSASMWAFKDDDGLVGAIKALKGVTDVKIERY